MIVEDYAHDLQIYHVWVFEMLRSDMFCFFPIKKLPFEKGTPEILHGI